MPVLSADGLAVVVVVVVVGVMVVAACVTGGSDTGVEVLVRSAGAAADGTATVSSSALSTTTWPSTTVLLGSKSISSTRSMPTCRRRNGEAGGLFWVAIVLQEAVHGEFQQLVAASPDVYTCTVVEVDRNKVTAFVCIQHDNTPVWGAFSSFATASVVPLDSWLFER